MDLANPCWQDWLPFVNKEFPIHGDSLYDAVTNSVTEFVNAHYKPSKGDPFDFKVGICGLERLYLMSDSGCFETLNLNGAFIIEQEEGAKYFDAKEPFLRLEQEYPGAGGYILSLLLDDSHFCIMTPQAAIRDLEYSPYAVGGEGLRERKDRLNDLPRWVVAPDMCESVERFDPNTLPEPIREAVAVFKSRSEEVSRLWESLCVSFPNGNSPGLILGWADEGGSDIVSVIYDDLIEDIQQSFGLWYNTTIFMFYESWRRCPEKSLRAIAAYLEECAAMANLLDLIRNNNRVRIEQ